MKSSTKLVLTIVVTAALVITLGYFCVKAGRKIQQAEDLPVQYRLERQIDSLEEVISQVERLYSVESWKRDSLNRELKASERNMEKLEKKYNEKIRSITSYSSPELEQFFADRYSTD